VNRGRRLGRFGIGEEVAASDVLGEDHDIDAAVLSPALSSVVAGDGVKFGVSGGREAVRRKAVTQDQESNQFGRAGSRWRRCDREREGPMVSRRLSRCRRNQIHAS
jgi:hypothetical protein